MKWEKINNEIVQIFLVGDVKISAIKEISKFVDKALKAGENRFVFNLEKVTSIDAAGLGGIITCKKKVENAGGTAVTLNKPGLINNILRATGLDSKLHTVMSCEEAIKFFKT